MQQTLPEDVDYRDVDVFGVLHLDDDVRSNHQLYHEDIEEYPGQSWTWL